MAQASLLSPDLARGLVQAARAVDAPADNHDLATAVTAPECTLSFERALRAPRGAADGDHATGEANIRAVIEALDPDGLDIDSLKFM